LEPTLEAVRKGKRVALANKEALVAGGSIVMAAAKDSGAMILPIDSEHCAIFQCIAGNKREDIRRIILTASGGPFRRHNAEMLEHVTTETALDHPTWKMGGKITIDSATLMNKGFEVIEAHWLFDIDVSNVDVLIHPQSIIHSMVEYRDGSVMAQLGPADMRIPIQFALTWPERAENPFQRLDLIRTGKLTFENPDVKRFGCLKLAYDAANAGGTMPAVLNGANEAAVEMFLNGSLKFKEIPVYIGRVMDRHSVISVPDLFDVLEADQWARRQFITEVRG
jgi:1-deoxy-D-xylulose-5-phosphate reductoisomerase